MKNTEVRLEKKLSPLNVWALAFGCIIGFGAFMLPGNKFLVNAGPLGTTIALLIGAIVMILIAFNYHYMIAKYPLAGGEFTYTQNVFGIKHGFVCAWFLVLSYATLVPMNATALAVIARNLVGNIFQFGFHYTLAGYEVYLGEMLLAALAIVLFGYLSIRGVKFAGCFQVILTFCILGGLIIVVAAAVINPNATISNLIPLFNPNTAKFSGICTVLAVAPFLFVGFDTIPQSAEEFKFSNKKTKVIMIVAILFGALVYITLTLLTASVIPEGFSCWVDYISVFNTFEGLSSLPTFYVAYELLGYFGVFVFGIAVMGATLSGIVGFYMATTRLLYSISKEHLIPKWFGELHTVYKTPRNSIIFVMLLSLLLSCFGRTALGWLVDMSSLGAAIGYAYTSAAAFKLSMQEKNVSTMITGLIGTLMGIVFAILLLVPIPGLNCSLGKESYVCLGIWIMLGIIFKLMKRNL